MIAQYDNSCWIDMDKVSAFSCDMTDKNPDKWTASFIIDGVSGELEGAAVKNLSESFKWKWGPHSYDMRLDSPRFKKQGV